MVEEWIREHLDLSEGDWDEMVRVQGEQVGEKEVEEEWARDKYNGRHMDKQKAWEILLYKEEVELSIGNSPRGNVEGIPEYRVGQWVRKARVEDAVWHRYGVEVGETVEMGRRYGLEEDVAFRKEKNGIRLRETIRGKIQEMV